MSFFTPETDPRLFFCPCGNCDVHPENALVLKLETTRRIYGHPIIVTSGPRCPTYNASVGGEKDSEHLTGEAADLACPGSRERWDLLNALLRAGFNRLGIGKNFIHTGISPAHDPNVIWTYYKEKS